MGLSSASILNMVDMLLTLHRISLTLLKMLYRTSGMLVATTSLQQLESLEHWLPPKS